MIGVLVIMNFNLQGISRRVINNLFRNIYRIIQIETFTVIFNFMNL